VTIAAGFLCSDGVLLCTDTQHTAYAMKIQNTKSDDFEFPGGKLAYAYAGNTHFAVSAMQACRKHMQEKNHPDPLAAVEGALEREYRRNVLKHPDHTSDGSLDYQLLLALWLPQSATKLYLTSKTALEEITTYRCIGVGEYLGNYLIEPAYTVRLEARKAFVIGAYAIAAAKEHVDGCGGMSIFTLLQNDGRVGFLTSTHEGICQNIDGYQRPYEFLTKELLMSVADDELEDSDLARYIAETFTSRLLDVHRRWRKAYKDRIANFTALNPHLTEDQAKQLFHELSMGVAPIQQP
jgi:hypothetical protein